MSEHEPFDLSYLDEEYTNAEVKPNTYAEIPDGKYQVSVEKVELAHSKTANNPMLKWQLNIINGLNAGRKLFKNSMITANSLKFLKMDLMTVGYMGKLGDLEASLHVLLDVCIEIKKVTKGENSNIYFVKKLNIKPPENDNSSATGQYDDIPF